MQRQRKTGQASCKKMCCIALLLLPVARQQHAGKEKSSVSPATEACVAAVAGAHSLNSKRQPVPTRGRCPALHCSAVALLSSHTAARHTGAATPVHAPCMHFHPLCTAAGSHALPARRHRLRRGPSVLTRLPLQHWVRAVHCPATCTTCWHAMCLATALVHLTCWPQQGIQLCRTRCFAGHVHEHTWPPRAAGLWLAGGRTPCCC